MRVDMGRVCQIDNEWRETFSAIRDGIRRDREVKELVEETLEKVDRMLGPGALRALHHRQLAPPAEMRCAIDEFMGEMLLPELDDQIDPR